MKQTILAKELERQIGIEVTDNINSKIALQGMKKKQTYYVFGIKNHKFVRMLYCHKRNEIGSKIMAMGRMDIIVYYPINPILPFTKIKSVINIRNIRKMKQNANRIR